MPGLNTIYRMFILFLLVLNTLVTHAQCDDKKEYDVFNDTLLVISDKNINTERIFMKREEIVNADTFRINQKGLTIVSFTMSAITLGNSVELVTDKPILSTAMRNEILNKQWNYKFIYIKNINLQTKDGRTVHPSMRTLKIIFSN